MLTISALAGLEDVGLLVAVPFTHMRRSIPVPVHMTFGVSTFIY